MVKERLIENCGVPFFTIGTGGSGGAYQSHQTGDNYPGLFDGIIVTSVFPDVTSSTIFKLHDSRLLHLYFTQDAPGQYSDAQRSAISTTTRCRGCSDRSSPPRSRARGWAWGS